MKKNQILPIIVIVFLGLCLTCFCCVAGLLAIRSKYEFAVVDGISMEPNYKSGEVYIVERSNEFKKGDVVIFKTNSKIVQIKRIIAGPGDEVQLKDGKVFVNSELSSFESIVDGPTHGGTFFNDNVTYKVPTGKYFLLGDNRSNSLDSRYTQIEFVHESLIIGIVKEKLY